MPRQNSRHFAVDTFKRIFVNKNVRSWIKISLKFVSKGAINNIPALVHLITWRQPSNKYELWNSWSYASIEERRYIEVHSSTIQFFLYFFFKEIRACLQHYGKTDERIFRKFSGKIAHETKNNLEHFRVVVINPLKSGSIFFSISWVRNC